MEESDPSGLPVEPAKPASDTLGRINFVDKNGIERNVHHQTIANRQYLEEDEGKQKEFKERMRRFQQDTKPIENRKKSPPGKLYDSYRHLYRETFEIDKRDKKRFKEASFRSWQREVKKRFLGKGIERKEGNKIFVNNNIKMKLKITIGRPPEKQP